MAISNLFRNPLFEKWFGPEEKNDAPENGDGEVKEVEEKPESIKQVFTDVKNQFDDIIQTPISIELDLKNPFPNPRISVAIKTPKTAKLGQIVSLEYTFQHLEEGHAFFVIQLDEEDESDMMIYLGKTINLVEFTEETKEVKVVLEALVHHSGVYRVPDLIITDFKGTNISYF